MDLAFENYLAQAQDSNLIDLDDIPKTNRDPVWILGRRYNAIQGFQPRF